MSKRDSIVRVRHMLDAAEKVVNYISQTSRDRFDDDEMRQLALVRLIEVIGEASKQTTPEFRETHAEIEWQKIGGMRDRLIHGYDTVNLDILWNTCNEDVPKLIAQLREILK
jgi:uncharacterized protein with HEPN domain